MVRNNITGANYGILSWLYQRISAIVMVITFILFLIMIIYLETKTSITFYVWRKFFSCIYVKLILQVFFCALIIHSWVGMRDICMDYIKCKIIKLFIHSGVFISLFLCFIYSLKVFWF